MHELLHAALVWTAVACAPTPGCGAQVQPSVQLAAAAAPDRGDLRQVASGPPTRHDPWLGHDKFTHAGVSWAATTFAFGAARAAGLSTDDALFAAVPLSLALGVAKELVDRRTSFFSMRDLLADAVGTAAAYLFLREVR